MTLWIYLGVLATLFGLTAGFVANARGASAIIGFIVGFLFGPFGAVWAHYMGDEDLRDAMLIKTGQRKQCPACSEVARTDANVCPHCRHDFTALHLKVSDAA